MIRLLLIFATTNLLLHPVQGQVLQPYFHNLTQADGLNQGQNAFLYKDRQGFIWISTTEGINRYDSREVIPYKYKPNDPNSLQDGLVTGPFFEDKNSDLWFSTSSNISCYRRKTDHFEKFSLLSKEGDTLREGYFLFYTDRKARLWVNVGSDLHLFDPSTGRDSIVGLMEGNRLTVQENATGQPYRVFSPYKIFENGLDLYELAGNNWQKRTLLRDTKTWYVLPEADTLVWVGANKGLVALNPMSGKERVYRTWGDSTVRAHDVAAWGQRYLLVSTPHLGILVFDKTTRQFTGQFKAQPGRKGRLRQNNVRELFIDRDNVLWASLWPVGLDFTDLDKARFPLILDSQTPLRPDNTLGIVEDRLGQVWISTTNGVYLFDAASKEQHFWPYSELVGNAANRDGTLSLDLEGKVWLVTLHDIVCFDPARLDFKHVAKAAEKAYYLKKIYFLPNGDTAVLHFGAGILRCITTGALASHPAFHVLRNASIDYLYETPTGELLAAEDRKGLLVLHGEGHRRQIRDSFLFPGLAMDFQPDVENKALIWLSTTQGLAQLDLGKRTLTFLNEKNGIPGQLYYQSFLHQKEWWLTGNTGIVRYDPARQKSIPYDLTDGLQSNEFNQVASIQDRRGRFWMGGPLGVNLFHPDSIEKKAQNPVCRLIRCLADEMVYPIRDGTKALVFNTRSVNLALEVHVLDFSRPGIHRLRYQLKGYEDKWVEASDNAPIRYPNLPVGRYLFRVQAANADGEWAGDWLEIPVLVSPPFYQRDWFFWLLGLLTAGLASYGWYRYRTAQIRRQAAIDQRLAELETRALRSQLDHHFVFNTLNAIKVFVIQADVENAAAYLDRFAYLMRLILFNTQKTDVSLMTELDLLENYIRIEQLRFGHKFDFSIKNDIPPENDPEKIAIPSLVLQPYVENAILHGLKNKRDGKGLLTIHCSIQAEQLHILIEDNGVGREKAAEIKAKQSELGRTHPSVGLDIVQQRIQAFARQKGGVASIKITDLFDIAGLPIGTSIHIALPFHPEFSTL